MIACSCQGVSDRTVRAAVRAGATDVDAVGDACGAGTVCGGCRPTIEEILVDPDARRWRRRRPAGVGTEVTIARSTTAA